MKATDHRITRNVLLAVYGTLLLLCTGIIVAVHINERRDQRREALERLSLTTSTLAAQVNANHLEQLLRHYDGRGMIFKNTQDARYYVLHELLRRTQERTEAALPVRIVVYDSLKQELQVVVTGEQSPSFRHVIENDATYIRSHYGRPARNTERNARLLAMDPIVNDEGRVMGMVLATLPASEAHAKANAALWRNISIVLALFLVAGFFLKRSVGRWVDRDAQAHSELQLRHTDVTDSIAYASKIQRALVPRPEVYNEMFDASFVIDRPKDTLSGDFHWAQRLYPQINLVAAADCTGHGLPGAMIGAMACSLLNEIATTSPDLDPAQMLGLLNTRLVTSLHQQGQQCGGGDGLDIALCRVDREAREILFAGAMRPLYWLHQGQLSVINGDRKPVGGAHHELERKYTVHRIAYSPGDRIYLFSDGYVDQFGGADGRRFMASRLQELIGTHGHLAMDQQARVLEQAFLEWKGGREQMDDVCMLGLAV
ncbi:MAG: serine/threonine-protein phosphatase [Flavobacteriales bacterium]|nr:serine/threonine-protein phosphatase [Flavobacteriales bacterium]